MSKQAAPRRVGEKEALSVGTTIRGSAQKLNLVARCALTSKQRRGRRGRLPLASAHRVRLLSQAPGMLA